MLTSFPVCSIFEENARVDEQLLRHLLFGLDGQLLRHLLVNLYE